MTLHLISLTGGGDHEKKLVDQETWDWINSPRPNFGAESLIQEMPSIHIREGIFKERFADSRWPGPKTPEEVTVDISVGSWKNDRAIWAPAVYEIYEVKELMKICKEHDIEIGEEYEGHIY